MKLTEYMPAGVFAFFERRFLGVAPIVNERLEIANSGELSLACTTSQQNPQSGGRQTHEMRNHLGHGDIRHG